MMRVSLTLATALLALAACTAPGAGPTEARLDAIAPTAGAPGTTIEITGRFPADAALHLCDTPIENLSLGGPETILVAPGIQATGDVRTRATGTVPALGPDRTCPVTIVRDGRTLPASGTDPTFTTTLWSFAARAGGPEDVLANEVAVLADGSAIVAGSFRGTATFGSTALTSAGESDAFVAKVARDGTWAWATRAGGPEDDSATAVVALADGGALITGSFRGTATFGTTDLTSAGDLDAYVAKIAPDGTWTWATRAGGNGEAAALSVAAFADGSAIVTGFFEGAATFGDIDLTSAGGLETFVAKIDADGAWAWATNIGGTSRAGSSVATLADGSAIIAGFNQGTATFGGIVLPGDALFSPYVARIGPDGTWAWATRAGGTEDAFSNSISALADGSAIVAGSFRGTAAFGGIDLTSAGDADAFVATIDPDGTWARATRAGGPNDDLVTGIATRDDGAAVVTGWFTGTATFGATDLTSAGGIDVFVARIVTGAPPP
jgi:hypothetical protein